MSQSDTGSTEKLCGPTSKGNGILGGREGFLKSVAMERDFDDW